MKVVVELAPEHISKLQESLGVKFEQNEEGEMDAQEIADAVTELIEVC